MSIPMSIVGERQLVSERIESEKYKPEIEEDRLTEVRPLAEKNLKAKKVMASELASMGLSRAAIGRLLHLEEKSAITRPK